MENINLTRFHLTDNQGKPCGVFDNAIVEEIKNKFNLFIMAQVPYFYDGGYYKPDFSGARLKTLIKRYILPRFIKSTTITRIYQLFLMDYELLKDYRDINKYPQHWICFKNGMYDVLSDSVRDNSPEYFCINQIPHEYNKEKIESGIETESFFKASMSEEDRKTILQFLGLCMTRDNSFQKFILLKGSRGTGKSQIIGLFEKVIGNENFSNVPLQRLEEKFYSIQIMGKLANLCADLNASPMKTVATIKLITGGDTLSDSLKGRDIITFKPYSKLLFSCNSVPISLDEKSDALFERIIIVEMDRKPNKPDRRLGEKLEQEIPYIINSAISELKQLYEDNRMFESTRCKELVMDLYKDSDSVKAFIEDKLIIDVKESIKTTDLLEDYKKYCVDTEREPLSKTNFYRNITSKGIGKKTIHGSEYFNGIGIKLASDNLDIPFT